MSESALNYPLLKPVFLCWRSSGRAAPNGFLSPRFVMRLLKAPSLRRASLIQIKGNLRLIAAQ
jgi:hypothetical protein